MPVEAGSSLSATASPSAPSELAWILNLLLQTSPYAPPALRELEESLLPGITKLQDSVRADYGRLWADHLPGCPELLLAAHHSGSLLDADLSRLLRWLARSTNQPPRSYELLTEEPRVRPQILARLDRLCMTGTLRARYGELLERVWQIAGGPWQREGRRIAEEASRSWLKRLAAGGRIEELVAPRHPLRRADELEFDAALTRRTRVVVSPIYLCLSGGHVLDVDEYLHVAVAASDLLPVRKVRDAMFVASRMRVLAEPTRVRLLIQIMSAPAGVMELARALHMSQPAVSGHLRVLREAGLVHPRKLGPRSVLVASRKRIDQLLEDARGTLARWD